MGKPESDPSAILRELAVCVEQGKRDASVDIPRGTAGQPGASEWAQRGLAAGMDPLRLLNEGLIVGMQRIGRRFAANEVFIPEVLIAARAMQAGVDALKPALMNRDVPSRGTFVIGTVRGDLHDIGKNIVAIMFRGVGWKVIDLGVDCSPEVFCEAIESNPGCVVGLSALLTTTMINMGDAVEMIRLRSPGTKILVGGAPVDTEFAAEIGADAYAADPHEAIEWLNARMPEK